jgi:hypothetical protein
MKPGRHGKLPEAELLQILNTLATGSLLTFDTMLRRVADAFPDLLVAEEGLPVMPLFAFNEPSPALIKALAAASKQALNNATCMFLVHNLSISGSGSSILLKPLASAVMTICCTTCSTHMGMSIFGPSTTEAEQRSAQVQMAVAAQATGADSLFRSSVQ